VKLLALLLSLFALPAFAQGYTAKWSAPLLNTDGSKATETLNYNLYQATQGKPLAKVQTGIAGLTTTITAGLTPGTTQCFAVSALNTSTGGESAQTAPVCVAIGQPVPGAPGGLTITPVTSSTIAYTIIMGNDKLVPLIVGSAPLGTPCDVTQPVLSSYFVIPRAAVTWSSALRPTTTVALCSG
jgi:hypothetical protein